MAVEEGADTVDINMGCPVNKITKMAVGLLYCVNQKQLEAIVRSVKAVDVCHSQNSHWLDRQGNQHWTLPSAWRMQGADDNGHVLHPCPRLNGLAKWEWIGRVRKFLRSVIANGDIFP